MNFETASQAALSCHSGKLSRLVSFGLTKDSESVCAPGQLEEDQEVYLQDGVVVYANYTNYLDFKLGRDKPERKYIKNFIDFIFDQFSYNFFVLHNVLYIFCYIGPFYASIVLEAHEEGNDKLVEYAMYVFMTT